MTQDQSRRGAGGEHAAAGPPPPEGEITMVAPLAGDDADDDAEGGDPVCWAHLVCDECGAITTEGHREGCSAGAAR